MRRFSIPVPVLPGRPVDPHVAEAARQTVGHLNDLQSQLDLVTGTDAPSVQAKSAAGSSTAAVVRVTGNDLAGVVTLTTGSPCASGILAALRFSKPRPAIPFSVHFAPANARAATATAFIDPANVSASKWSLSTASPLASGVTYAWAYRVSSP